MRLLRFGSAVGLGAAASLAGALPATFRVAGAVSSTEGTTRVWVALAGTALVPMIAAVLLLRGARDGLRAFAGPGVELRAFGVGLWLASMFVAFSLYGSVLRATTHHHALAGVTYACGALVIAIGSAIACARVVAILTEASDGGRRWIAGALALVTALSLAWIGLRFVRAVSHDPGSAGAAAVVVDVLALALAAGFAARPSFADWRGLAVMGPPVALTVLALGLISLHDEPLRSAIGELAPAYWPIVGLVP
jgi:hypothetical protein